MGMTTTVYLRSLEASEALDKKLVVTVTESVAAGKVSPEVPCDFRVERLDDNMWAVHLTPLKAGTHSLQLHPHPHPVLTLTIF
jgi:hypothetical protein